jgi:hypothetical protein
VQRRLVPALEAAESGLDLVLKAQVYLNADAPAFREAWKRAFGVHMPPTVVVPVRHPAFLTREATVEVNVIAAHRSARARLRDIEGKARMLDGLLFAGGLSSLAEAREIFDLSHVVRGLFFHAKGAAPADPGFPYSAIEVESGFTIDLWGYAP